MHRYVLPLILSLSCSRRLLATDYCATNGTDYDYSEAVSSSGAKRTINMNGCPNHAFTNAIGDNPNKAVKGSKTYKIPGYPKYSPTDQTDVSAQGGAIGVLFSGALIYSAYGGASYGQVSSWSNSAVRYESDTFDECGCHSSSSTSVTYHCHIPNSCQLRQMGQQDDEHSPQIGWMADGFPLYGPRGPGGVMMKTCTVTGGTYGVDICLDDCGGFYNTTKIDDGYKYRYYLQGNYSNGLSCSTPTDPVPGAEFYPFTPVCLNGCYLSSLSFSGFSFMNDCTDSAYIDGYTSKSDVPGAMSSLSRNEDGCNTPTSYPTVSPTPETWSPTTPRPTPVPTSLPTPIPTTPSPSSLPTAGPSPAPTTPSPSQVPTAAPTPSPTTSFKPSASPSVSFSPTTSLPSALPTTAPSDPPVSSAVSSVAVESWVTSTHGIVTICVIGIICVGLVASQIFCRKAVRNLLLGHNHSPTSPKATSQPAETQHNPTHGSLELTNQASGQGNEDTL